MYQHVLVSSVQSGITIDSDSISGTLIGQNDWVWDPFNFKDGVIGSAPFYYIALDFSDNVFEGLTSVLVECGSGSPVELLDDADKIVILEVKDTEILTITQTTEVDSMVQIFSLTDLTFS